MAVHHGEETVRASFDIHYEVRSRNRGLMRFREPASIEVLEVPADMAPVAVEWDDGYTRFFNGHHYRFVGKMWDESMPASDPDHALSRAIEYQGWSRKRDIAAYVDTEVIPKDRKFSAARYPDIEHEFNREVAHEKLETLASHALVVGDELLIRCGEPHLHLKLSRFDPKLTGVVEIDCTQYTFDATKGRYFTAPDLDGAAMCRRLDDPEGIVELAAGLGLAVTVPETVVREPRSLCLDDLSDSALHAAHGMCMFRHSGVPGSFEIDAIRPMIAELEELLYGEAFDADTACDILSRIAPELTSPNSAHEARCIAAVVDRWNGRPVVLSSVTPSTAPI